MFIFLCSNDYLWGINNQPIIAIMKRKGSKVECADERISELMKLYRERIKDCKHISIDEVLADIVELPCHRFWVSEKRAFVVISAMVQGKNILAKMRTPKREMYSEIYNRVIQIKREKPTLSLLEICEEVIYQPAPKIYLSPGSAKIMIYKYLQEKRKCRA